MKQQKFFGIILGVCALMTIAGCASTSTFDGNRVKNADSYQLDIKTMNCTLPGRRNSEGIYRGGSYGWCLSHRRRGA